jgi:hypothetical protein
VLTPERLKSRIAAIEQMRHRVAELEKLKTSILFESGDGVDDGTDAEAVQFYLASIAALESAQRLLELSRLRAMKALADQQIRG